MINANELALGIGFWENGIWIIPNTFKVSIYSTLTVMLPGTVTYIVGVIQISAQNYCEMAFTVSINTWEDRSTKKFGGWWMVPPLTERGCQLYLLLPSVLVFKKGIGSQTNLNIEYGSATYWIWGLGNFPNNTAFICKVATLLISWMLYVSLLD